MASAPVRRFPITATLAAICSVVVFSGCSLLDGPTPGTADRAAVEAPEGEVSYFPDGSAADNLPIFTKTLVEYGKGSGAIDSEPIERALVDVGFEADSIEVTQDVDPFGNDAESIFVSSRFDDQCLIGQLVEADREVIVEQTNTIGPDGDQCLIVQPRS